MPFSPMLAATAGDLKRLRFPLLASPKFDGMRLAVGERGPVTKNGHPLPNEKARAHFGRPELAGLDGELICGDPTAPDAVQRSIHAGMSRLAPIGQVSFWVFDSFETPDAPFEERYAQAMEKVARAGVPRVHMVPQFEVASLEELQRVEVETLARNFEGLMLRKPKGRYVFGRVTPGSRILLKLKRRTIMEGEAIALLRGAVLVKHPEWPRPFEVPLHGKRPAPDIVGKRVRFSRHPGTWQGAPRSPLYVGVA